MDMKYFILLFVFTVGVLFSGCSKKSDVEYMDTAANSVKQNNIPQAVEAYENLIREYPQSPKAPDAMFQLATLYQNKLVKNISEQESLNKAVEIFKNVFDKYPGSQIAPKSLFMAGFILANDIHDFNQATTIFNLFLQKYPNNELAASAKEELNNMGLSPEEILQKKKDSKS